MGQVDTFKSDHVDTPKSDKVDQVMAQSTKNRSLFANSNTDTGIAQAEVGLVDVVDKSGLLTANAKAFTAGASAQISPEYTGTGVKATWVEGGVDVGGVVGAKVGLSADTELGAGKSGVTAKALGTGLKMDTTGLEVSVFGSGVKLGKWASPFHWFS